MDKREQMLSMIERFERHVSVLPESLQANLTKIKDTLQTMTTEEVEAKTDGVFTTPATNRQFQENPAELLLYSYSEMENVAREEEESTELYEVIKQMQTLFSIEEKDGYFP
ncbi:hypothetical protein [Desertibacillus haloalkaliphilus]|uniref:hypothetical protein n=1 Tax=Desertibacillus haloalkaliphilus TaxID=1328930 RepID=UPI001C256AA2|nr:hypothetical protein [Desertibacillus haloalkaliphilus]MBU8905554.1 hypothetical protein [Desertibacillus haloalkaliphilus]